MKKQFYTQHWFLPVSCTSFIHTKDAVIYITIAEKKQKYQDRGKIIKFKCYIHNSLHKNNFPHKREVLPDFLLLVIYITNPKLYP